MKAASLIFSLLLSMPCFGSDADAQARYIAGLPASDATLRELTHTRDWQGHARAMDETWRALDRKQLQPVRDWTQANVLRGLGADCPLFYFFSGPDMLYARLFHPNAPVYVLCGMEPVGRIPQVQGLAPTSRVQALGGLRKGLSSALNYSFFRTKDMAIDLQSTSLTGTLPILYTYLARMSCSLHRVTLVGLDDEGNLVPADLAITPGVRIEFRASGAQRPQRLYYFQTDLSNAGINRHPGFLAFCKSFGVGHGLLKAASYLLHDDDFSLARHFVTTRCRSLIEDDSGIPLKHLVSQRWMVLPHGNYTGPIPLFAARQQIDLTKLFQGAQYREPLGFSFGYRWRSNESSLLYGIALGYESQAAPLAARE